MVVLYFFLSPKCAHTIIPNLDSPFDLSKTHFLISFCYIYINDISSNIAIALVVLVKYKMAKLVLCLSFLIIAFALVNVCKASTEIGFYELKNDHLSVNITNYGATVLSFLVPDRNGELIQFKF